jgi:digeranylgeranylglycerophospholipid reductase
VKPKQSVGFIFSRRGTTYMARESDFDVVVVGCGPAGSSAAKAAAEGGARVLLLEEHHEIGSPVQCCGVIPTGIGLLSHASPFCKPTKGISGEQLVERTFQNAGFKFETRLIMNRLHGLRMFLLGGALDVEKVEKEPIAFILNRGELDKHLAMEASRSGVELIVGARVDRISFQDKGVIVGAHHNGRAVDFDAKIVIGADGPVSDVAKLAGLKMNREFLYVIQYEMVGVNLETKDKKENFDLRSLNIGASGMAYINPIGEDSARVGLGTLATGVNLVRCFEKLKGTNPIFKVRVSEAKAVSRILDVIPLTSFKEETVADSVMLVGDAAAQASPVSGDGIYPAMFCGRIAGEVAAKAIQKEDYSKNRLMEYDKRWKGLLKPKYESLIEGRGLLFRIMNKMMELPPDQIKDMAEFLRDETFIAAVSGGMPVRAVWNVIRHREALKPLRKILKESGFRRFLLRRIQ